MQKYLFIGSYVGDGLKGLLQEGGTRRIEAAQQLFEGVGGSLESFYFALGEAMLCVTFKVPDLMSAAAVSLMITSTGAVEGQVIPLLTPEEVDQVVAKGVHYRPPGR